MELAELDRTLEKLQQIKNLLTPDTIRGLELLEAAGKEPLRVERGARYLVRAGEAASILGVNKNRIDSYVKQGLLKAYYTPGSTQRKFWNTDLEKVVFLCKKTEIKS